MQTAERERDSSVTPVQRAMMNSEEEDLQSWTESLGQQAMRFTVRRISPKVYKGVQTEGSLATYDDPVSEDTIREQHGGGNYQVVVNRRHTNGKWLYFRTRMVKIPGNPRIDNILTMEEQAAVEAKTVTSVDGGGTGSLASQAMNSLQRQLEREQERHDRGNGSGFDPAMLSTVTAPIMAQLDGLNRALAAKDAQIFQLLSQKPEKPEGNPFQERILGSMLENESVRLESMRNRHESELRQLKEGHQQDMNRIHDSAKEELRVRERQHEREIDMIKESSKSASDAQKVGMDMRIDSLKSDIARLNAENAAHKVEIAELRAKKEKSLPEQAKEIAGMQETFKALGIGGDKDEDDDSDKPWYERMAGRVMENPGAIGEMLGGVRGAIAPAAPPAAPQLPPVGQPFQTPDGQVYVARPDGKVQRLNPAKRKAAAAAAAAVTAAKEGPKPPDASELKMAIQFMEGACMANTAPEVFAASARSAIDGGTLAYVEKVGIDELLNQANLDPGSVLRNQSGRNWARSVAKILLEGG